MQALEFVNYIADMLGYGQTTDIATDTSPDIRKVVRAGQAALKAMQRDSDWPELRASGVALVAVPVTTASEATVSLGSATVTLATLDGTTDIPYGSAVTIGTDTDMYRVISGTATTIVLDRPWREANVTTGTLVFAQDFVSLPADLDRIDTGEMRIDESGLAVKESDPATMRKAKTDKGKTLEYSDPTIYLIQGRDSSGNKKVHFDSFPEESINLSFDYQYNHPDLTTNTTEILYPESTSLYIFDAVIAKLRRDVEDSKKAQIASQDALREAVRVGSHPESTRTRTRMRSEGVKHGAYRRR